MAAAEKMRQGVKSERKQGQTDNGHSERRAFVGD